MSKVILVPVDFEQPSTHALDVAKDLARRLDATITLVHVQTLPVYFYPGVDPVPLPPTYAEELSVQAKRSLDALAASAGGLRALLLAGDPADEILKVVEELQPVMVVMGTHGRRGLSRLLLGSVAERVVRNAPVPVLTVRPPVEATKA